MQAHHGRAIARPPVLRSFRFYWFVRFISFGDITAITAHFPGVTLVASVAEENAIAVVLRVGILTRSAVAFLQASH